MDEREKSVYMAKLAEQAERYEGKARVVVSLRPSFRLLRLVDLSSRQIGYRRQTNFSVTFLAILSIRLRLYLIDFRVSCPGKNAQRIVHVVNRSLMKNRRLVSRRFTCQTILYFFVTS